MNSRALSDYEWLSPRNASMVSCFSDTCATLRGHRCGSLSAATRRNWHWDQTSQVLELVVWVQTGALADILSAHPQKASLPRLDNGNPEDGEWVSGFGCVVSSILPGDEKRQRELQDQGRGQG